jgi:hypothetical protein
MPYVKQSRRPLLAPSFDVPPGTAGELNFQLTELTQVYLAVHGTSYKTINDVIGALESAKLEFYRRVAAPYEDQKLKENGDVYGA